jgi:3-hydroxyisobutyrate dehydrogenase
MGGGMAARLVRAGFPLRVWNRTPGRMEPLLALGAESADTPATLAATCDIIFICVGGSADVEAVITGPHGLIETIRPGTLVVDHSTISPQTTRALAARLAERGAGLLDAPISGGSEGAANGTLSIMVGGESADLDRARPYLAQMGRTITHVGPTGAGQMVKLVNQILVVSTMQGIAEALLFAEAGGLDPEKMLAAVSGGAAASWALSHRAPQMVAEDWRPGFTIDWQAKDLRLVLESADALGVPLPATSLIFQLYRALQATGLGQEGNHALIKATRRLMAGPTPPEDGANG